MSPTLTGLLSTFTDRHVVVIGEAMLDSYLIGSADRLCQEAPVPVVTLSERRDCAGGAANVAVNLHQLGAQVSLLSVIGDDNEGDRLRHTLEQAGLVTDGLLVQASRRTLVKQRIMAASQMLVRLDQGSTEAIDPTLEQQLIHQFHQRLSRCDAIVVSDYSYGVLTPPIMQAIANVQATSPKLLVVDSKRLASYRSIGVTVVKPNYEEAIRLLTAHRGIAVSQFDSRLDQIVQHHEALLDITGAQMAVVTLDAEGAVILQREQVLQEQATHWLDAKPTTCIDTTGAGDTFISALTLALAGTAPVAIAVEVALNAAAVVVAKQGTATCSIEELQAVMATEMKRDGLRHHLPLQASADSNPSTKEVA